MEDEEHIMAQHGIPMGHCGDDTECPYPAALLSMVKEIKILRSIIKETTPLLENPTFNGLLHELVGRCKAAQYCNCPVPFTSSNGLKTCDTCGNKAW